MSSVEQTAPITTLRTSENLRVRWRERLRRLLPFLGPAFIVSVGYMDPGNWGTDIDGGSRFGYQLLWVILLSNLMAILLQTLSAKLGIATGRTLPQLCRDNFSKPVNMFLWITAEIAAMATDLAEFLGAALGLYLLFGIPMFPAALLSGVIISAILALEQFGHRKLEKVIIGLVAVIGFAYIIEILMSQPDLGSLMSGLLIPRLSQGSILVAVGIIGATVMPHNLYLHSALVQPRRHPTDAAKNKHLYKMSKIDSLIALNGAWLVNSAILIMSAATFANNGLAVTSIEEAHQTLAPLLGGLSALAFAIALLASGLASSTTATMAGANAKATVENGKTVLTFPAPNVPGATVKITFNAKMLIEQVETRDGTVVTQTNYSDYGDQNESDYKADIMFPKRMVRTQGGMTVLDLTTLKTNTYNPYVIVPIPQSVMK